MKQCQQANKYGTGQFASLSRCCFALLIASSLLLSGCAAVNKVIYKTSGYVIKDMARDLIVPFTLEQDDLAMSCSMSEATAPLLLSFERVSVSPDKIAVILYLAAGACEEERALESELRYLRALRNQNPEGAEDALIEQRRHLRQAAIRQYNAWLRLVEEYGEPGGKCPSLDSDFDEFIWMAGILAGLQGLGNEIVSTASVGIPKDIGSKAERAAGCLTNKRWFGVPRAIRATVWTLLPGGGPSGEDPKQTHLDSDAMGEREGVRLAHVLHALAAFTKGDIDTVKDIIRKHAKSKKERPSRVSHKLLDAMATQYLQAISDRMWTENTGHRTPFGGLGTFWDDKVEVNTESVDLDDIL